MDHLHPVNRKARRIAARAAGLSARAQSADVPLGCTSIFSPGWEVDATGGVHGLCQPIERDLYDCYHSCYWPGQVPDSLTNWPDWSESCGAAAADWQKIDLVFP